MDDWQLFKTLPLTSLTLSCTAPAQIYGSLATFQDVTELVSVQQSRLVQLNWKRLLSPSMPCKDPGSDLPWDSLQLSGGLPFSQLCLVRHTWSDR